MDEGETGSIQGHVRLTPTMKSSLSADYFPHLFENGESPRSPEIFEATRFMILPLSRDRAEYRRVVSRPVATASLPLARRAGAPKGHRGFRRLGNRWWTKRPAKSLEAITRHQQPKKRDSNMRLKLSRPITPDEVNAYHQAGVVLLRGVLDLATVNLMRRCIDDGLKSLNASPAGYDLTSSNSRRCA